MRVYTFLLAFMQVALLAACVSWGLKVLSAIGAGARTDHTKICVADLRESTNDPLSRAVTAINFATNIYLLHLPAIDAGGFPSPSLVNISSDCLSVRRDYAVVGRSRVELSCDDGEYGSGDPEVLDSVDEVRWWW
ncbi:hypothetical protein RHMOL_Rhmol12G0136900 [Rhododendron molle]|uniref:Uncharacterized protein n=1 Tax=Rhododendron molle TaxID=49168 RepID=A0ACC0LJC4_RHOML|nr:hypothetical protein RHMOL_Rhmol12G0136900 [Rhododendron molle]